MLARLFSPRQPAPRTEASSGDSKIWQPSVYLGIEPDGTVKIVAHRSEMGTGSRTCLPMIVADELEADWNRVTIVQALGDVKYGSQNTDGSCSVRDFYDALRVAGAGARTMLEQAAAGKWGVPQEECQGPEALRRARQERSASCRTANWFRWLHATAPQQNGDPVQDAGASFATSAKKCRSPT